MVGRCGIKLKVSIRIMFGRGKPNIKRVTREKGILYSTALYCFEMEGCFTYPLNTHMWGLEIE
jgi:hypothetical protein